MKNTKSIFVIIVMTVCLISCGTLNVKVKPGTKFSRNTTVTIAVDEDQSGTVGELNHLLFENGFNVVAYSTAKKAVKYKDEIKGSDPINNKFEAEIYSIKELNSIYALELDYTYYYDMFYYAYRSFSARVIDLNTGEIVMSANFRGDKSVGSVLEDFVNQLSQQVK
jgi:hypothetical protein